MNAKYVVEVMLLLERLFTGAMPWCMSLVLYGYQWIAIVKMDFEQINISLSIQAYRCIYSTLYHS